MRSFFENLQGERSEDIIYSGTSFSDIQEETTGKPQSAMQEETAGKPQSAMQEETTGKPQSAMQEERIRKPRSAITGASIDEAITASQVRAAVLTSAPAPTPLAK